MRRAGPEIHSETDPYVEDSFVLDVSHAEARRQLWIGGALCGIMLAALLAATFAGTA